MMDLLNLLPEWAKMALIRLNWRIIQFVKEPTEALQEEAKWQWKMEAFKPPSVIPSIDNGHIKAINNAPLDKQLEALKEDPTIFRYLDLSEELINSYIMMDKKLMDLIKELRDGDSNTDKETS